MQLATPTGRLFAVFLLSQKYAYFIHASLSCPLRMEFCLHNNGSVTSGNDQGYLSTQRMRLAEFEMPPLANISPPTATGIFHHLTCLNRWLFLPTLMESRLIAPISPLTERICQKRRSGGNSDTSGTSNTALPMFGATPQSMEKRDIEATDCAQHLASTIPGRILQPTSTRSRSNS